MYPYQNWNQIPIYTYYDQDAEEDASLRTCYWNQPNCRYHKDADQQDDRDFEELLILLVKKTRHRRTYQTTSGFHKMVHCTI